ncbi:MAG: signal peptidase II, partial [Chloroflexota bacterium]|nr:signal peptidase II [Chloroflexota bacterium]
VIVSIVILIYYPQIPENETLMRIAMAMQMGGALGNMTDRIFFGPVTDFIAVGSFPVFNIADSSITVGVAVLILALWISERREKQNSLLGEQMQANNSDTVEN